MKNMTYLEQYNLILIRYNEIWLKSQKVKIRMLRILMNNIKNMLKHANIPFHKYQLSRDSSRVFFFFKNEDISKAVKVCKKVFGIYSISPALRTSSNLKNIIERSIEIGKEILKNGDTFALRVRRSGKHDFSSQDIAKQVGKAILDSFTELNLKVDLTTPKRKIFIEVRDEFAYIFTQIIKTNWGGLPIEKNKKIVVMDIGRLNDLFAGFLMMKRGCEIYPIFFNISEDDKLLEQWLNNWRNITSYTPLSRFIVKNVDIFKILKFISNKLIEKQYLCAMCRMVRFNIISKFLKESKFQNLQETRAISDGLSLNNSTICDDFVDLESLSLNYIFSEYPIFTPLIGFSLKAIKNIQNKISNHFLELNYCPFRPKNQEWNNKKINNLYNSLDIKDLIKESIENTKDIVIS